MLLVLLLIRRRRSQGNWLEVCDAELLPYLLDDKPLERSGTGLIIGGLVGLLAIIALAGPTWERLPSPAFRNDSALVIALDLSISMDAADIKPSRIAKARYKIADLLKHRRDGQTALLVYGGDAFTVTPLTSDTATIASQLEALTTDIMPSPGTNAGAAIRKAVELLQQAGLAKGHILLVTDGVDADSAALAERWLGDYRLSVLAVGTPEGAPIQQPGGFLKDANGNIVISRLDGEALAQLGAKGHGLYRQVTAGDQDVDDLGKLFNAADSNDNLREGNLLLEQWDDKGPWLLLLILPWAALRFRKGLLFWGLLCLLPVPNDGHALDWQSLWKNPDQRAQQAFDQRQYQHAAQQFDDPNWRAAAQYKAGQYKEAAETLKDTQTADGQYNRGNALAKSGQLQEALQAYQQALTVDPDHQDAKFNKALVEKKLQEQQKQQDQKPSQDQQSPSEPSQDQKQQNQGQQQDQKQGAESQSSPPDSGKQDQQKSDASQKSERQSDQQKQAAEDKKQQTEGDDQQAEQTEQPKSDKNGRAVQPETSAEQEEIERANQQLLKRIPDEPTGLLKRKFKYQYGQRRLPNEPGRDW